MLWGISEMVNARAVCKSSLLWYWWGSIAQSRFICHVLCTVIHGISVWYWCVGGPLAKVGLICHFLCTGIQGIAALVLGGPSAKVGSSAMLCVLECKAFLLCYQGVPLAKEGSSAKFCVLVFKASLLWFWGDFWSFGNERKPLSKLKDFFRKCSGVSQQQWVVELSNLCHCVQHPWKLTGMYFWSSGNEKSHFPRKMCFEEMLWSISEMVNARAVCKSSLLWYWGVHWPK